MISTKPKVKKITYFLWNKIIWKYKVANLMAYLNLFSTINQMNLFKIQSSKDVKIKRRSFKAGMQTMILGVNSQQNHNFL
jgi:hypothetical protein